MSSLLVDNIGELVTNGAGEGPLGIRRDAAVLVEEGRVVWVGPSAYAPAADQRVDAGGAAVLPGFVDSHAHLVFAGDRAAEFAARMAGQPYTGGGIRTTVGATRAATDEELRATVRRLRGEALRQGTTTIEIKSGYGLTVADEARSLRIAAETSAETTFLGAHVVPAEYADRPDDYVDWSAGRCWPPPLRTRGGSTCSASGAPSTWTTPAPSSPAVRPPGWAYGCTPTSSAPAPGCSSGVELAAASVDHCTHLSDADVAALAGTAHTVGPTLLPGAEFSTRSPYPDARRLLDAGVTVALATDCNPGSSYTSSMPFCVALAVREMRMTPAEAVRAATAGGARALRRDDVDLGRGLLRDPERRRLGAGQRRFYPWVNR